MRKKTAVTVRSLAGELDVSPITVSRALRGQDAVRPDLANKIRALAKKRGYRSDPLVAGVMGRLGRTGDPLYRETVAFVWTHQLSDSAEEERGAKAAAAALGYRVESIKPWREGLTERDVSRILWARGIRGVLLAPNYSRPDPSYELEWTKFAPVLLGSSLVNAGITRVARDYFHDAKLTLRRMQGRGFSRIGLVLDSSTHERTDRRYAAAFRAFGTGGGRWVHLVDVLQGEAGERRRLDRWLKRERPDAVLTDFAQARQWLPATLPQARMVLRPGETGPGVRADFSRIGTEGMRILDGLLRENRSGLQVDPVSLFVPGIWVDQEG